MDEMSESEIIRAMESFVASTFKHIQRRNDSADQNGSSLRYKHNMYIVFLRFGFITTHTRCLARIACECRGLFDICYFMVLGSDAFGLILRPNVMKSVFDGKRTFSYVCICLLDMWYPTIKAFLRVLILIVLISGATNLTFGWNMTLDFN